MNRVTNDSFNVTNGNEKERTKYILTKFETV